MRDHRTLFPESELALAYGLVVSEEAARERATAVYEQPYDEGDCYFTDDTITLLSMASRELAQLVQHLLSESDQQGTARIAELQTRLRGSIEGADEQERKK